MVRMDAWLAGWTNEKYMDAAIPSMPLAVLLHCRFECGVPLRYIQREEILWFVVVFFWYSNANKNNSVYCFCFGGVYHERTTPPMRTDGRCLTYSANRAKLTECLNAAARCFDTGTRSPLCYLTLFIGEKCCNFGDTQPLWSGGGFIWAYKPKNRIDDTLRRQNSTIFGTFLHFLKLRCVTWPNEKR